MLYQLSYFRRKSPIFCGSSSAVLEDFVGGGGLEPPNPEGADLQSAAIATMRTSQKSAYQCFQSSFEPIEGFEPTTPRLQITCSGQLSYIGSSFESFLSERTAKVETFFETTKDFQEFFIISVKRSRIDSESRPQSCLWAS